MIYLLVLLILITFTLFYDARGVKPNDSSYYWGICFLLIVLAGIRYRVGGDTLAYMAFFEDIPKIQNLSVRYLVNNEFQPFWIILNSISKSVINDFIFFQFLHAIIINIVVFRFIKRHLEYQFAGILLYYIFYFFYFNMEILRESLAIVVFLLSIESYQKKKWIYYYLYVIVAFLFHISAIILIVFPFFPKKIKFYKFLALIGVFTFILLNYQNYFINFLLNTITNEKITWAIKTHLRAEINVNGIIFILILKVILPLFLFFIGEKVLKFDYKFKPFIYLYVLLSFISIFIEPFYRFVNYLTPFFYLYLVELFHEVYISFFFFRVRQFIVVLFLFMSFIPQGYKLFKDTSDRVPGTRFYRIYVPYHTVFYPIKDIKREKLVKTYIGNY